MSYKKGRQFEYRVKRDLEQKGYFVIRSAGSHSPFDLIAFSQEGVLFIQCKTRKPRAREIELISSLPCPQGARFLFAYRDEKRRLCYYEAK